MPVSEKYMRRYERRFRAGLDYQMCVERTTKVANARARDNARVCEEQLELFAAFGSGATSPSGPRSLSGPSKRERTAVNTPVSLDFC